VLAYAFLVTYQAYYLLTELGSTEADVPQQIFLGPLVQSVLVVLASLVGGRVSDRTGRRKVFVLVASLVYGCALFVLAAATDVNGFLIGMAVSGLGFGMYVAVDLALVTQVLPDEDNIAKDLGVFTSLERFPSPSRRRLLQRFWPSAAAATASSTRAPGSAPFSERSPSCP
jgi:MFS family permease